MIRILFICHGNICRSPMAEYVMRNLLEKKGLSDRISAASAATSTEALGSPVHPGTRRILSRLGIDCGEKRAVQVNRADYDRYDYLVVMDERNLRSLFKILPGDPADKVYKLLDFTGRNADVADPWYTGDFEKTYQDISAGCQGLLAHILSK